MRSPPIKDPSWHRTIVNSWNNRHKTGKIVLSTTSEAFDAVCNPFPDWVVPEVVNALNGQGILRPYSHQVDAWNHLSSKKSTVIATPTASGKTLCYSVPVINRLIDDPNASALFLFPTKALARDQENAVRSLVAETDSDALVATYDGDTPSDARRKIRKSARIVVTNPDMLHIGILPHHSDWASFFSNLAFVVIDELHTYRGVFGSHVANVLRRMKRVCSFYGAEPVFATCSATIANPVELANKIIGENVELVSKSTAPKGARTFAVYNPEPIDLESGIRHSSLKETSKLAADLVEAGLLTLVFCQSRRSVELVLRYLRDKLTSLSLDPTRVKGYRGGYLPSVRREIETSFKNGELDAVIATNALELGIDIGSLDAVVMSGYPGTIAGLHQRSGRAGRKHAPSLAVLVTSADPLDQFLAREQHYLVEASPEHALTEPDNVEILLSHLKCSIFELPFGEDSVFGNLSMEDIKAAIEFLGEEGDVSISRGRAHYVGDDYPAGQVSLRSISAGRVVVRDKSTGDAIAEVDGHTARVELHEEAIYIAEGETYFVERLDLDSKIAEVTRIEPTYYTTPHRNVDIRVITEQGREELKGSSVSKGSISVKETILGFKKIRFHTHENLGYGDVSLPAEEMETDGVWLTPKPQLLNLLKEHGQAALLDGLSGLGYAFHRVASLRLMCDLRDLAYTVQNEMLEIHESAQESPSLFLYDSHSGGVGLSDRAFDKIDLILKDARDLIEGCKCKRGCPSCIGPGENASPKIKLAAGALVKGMVGLSRVE